MFAHVRNVVPLLAVLVLVVIARYFNLPHLPDILTGGKAIFLGLAIEAVALVIWLQMNDVVKLLHLPGGTVTMRPIIAVALGIFGAIVVDEGFLDINAPVASRIMWAIIPLVIGGIVYGAGSESGANGQTKQKAA